MAVKKGIRTIQKFFGAELARQMKEEGEAADLVIGNNVLAHVPKIGDFVEGLRIILKDNGIITLEFPHLLSMMQNNQFDTIYHEHFSYLSLISLNKILGEKGLKIIDVERLDTHGGSLRIYVTHLGSNISPERRVEIIIPMIV